MKIVIEFKRVTKVHKPTPSAVGQLSHPLNEAVYLLAYPRSGSTWFRYCIEFITKRKAGPPGEESLWKTGAAERRLLYSTHDFDDSEYNLIGSNARNIFLVRDYKEAVTSHAINWIVQQFRYHRDGIENTGAFSRKNIDLILKESPEIYSAIVSADTTIEHLLEWFEYIVHSPLFSEEFIACSRHELARHYGLFLVYHHVSKNWPIRAIKIKYEDFISKPALELMKVIDYLGNNFEEPVVLSKQEMRNNLKEFMENFDYHKNLSLKRYRMEHLALSTREKMTNMHYYSSRMKKETLLIYEDLLQDIDRYLPAYPFQKK